VVFFLAIFAVVFVRGRAFNAANNAGVRALTDGDFARAEGEFAALERRPLLFGGYASVARFNLALARLYLGRLEEAITLLARLDGKWSATRLKPQIANYLATAHALRGQLDAAKTWLAEAEIRIAKTPLPALSAQADLARAVIQLRSGQADEVHRWLETQWRGLERALTGFYLRPFAVLRAFATAHAGGQREAGIADRVMNDLQPIREGEFAMLEREWPEMQAFLARR
jgi:ATP/maltotriose-dependent transcriptional regulator MalT